MRRFLPAAFAACFAFTFFILSAPAQENMQASSAADFGRADKALADILAKMRRCTAEQGKAQGFRPDDFTVYRGDAPGGDTDGLQKIYCMGNFAAGLTQPQQHQIGIICSACLEKYDFCLYRDGHKLSGQERLHCLVNYDFGAAAK